MFEIAPNYNYDRIPTECPSCKAHIEPIHVISIETGEREIGGLKYVSLTRVFGCPNKQCREVFLSDYYFSKDKNKFIYINSYPNSLEKKEFSDNINDISEMFSIIYNQALEAETRKLDQIAGMGYRKSLEFLIKDFLISERNDEEEIKSKLLGNCIKLIDNTNIKNVAERAIWLGNDETHYVRKWLDKDIKDLKILIDLCLFHIDSHITTKKYILEMGG